MEWVCSLKSKDEAVHSRTTCQCSCSNAFGSEADRWSLREGVCQVKERSRGQRWSRGQGALFGAPQTSPRGYQVAGHSGACRLVRRTGPGTRPSVANFMAHGPPPTPSHHRPTPTHRGVPGTALRRVRVVGAEHWWRAVRPGISSAGMGYLSPARHRPVSVSGIPTDSKELP